MTNSKLCKRRGTFFKRGVLLWIMTNNQLMINDQQPFIFQFLLDWPRWCFGQLFSSYWSGQSYQQQQKQFAVSSSYVAIIIIITMIIPTTSNTNIIMVSSSLPAGWVNHIKHPQFALSLSLVITITSPTPLSTINIIINHHCHHCQLFSSCWSAQSHEMCDIIVNDSLVVIIIITTTIIMIVMIILITIIMIIILIKRQACWWRMPKEVNRGAGKSLPRGILINQSLPRGI